MCAGEGACSSRESQERQQEDELSVNTGTNTSTIANVLRKANFSAFHCIHALSLYLKAMEIHTSGYMHSWLPHNGAKTSQMTKITCFIYNILFKSD